MLISQKNAVFTYRNFPKKGQSWQQWQKQPCRMRTFPHPLSNFILTLSVRRPSVFLLYVPFTVYRAFCY